jgi:hypothetical protein
MPRTSGRERNLEHITFLDRVQIKAIRNDYFLALGDDLRDAQPKGAPLAFVLPSVLLP